MGPTFAEIVAGVRQLDHESKGELTEMIRAWMIEERRAEILHNARAAEAELAHGQTRTGSVDDLLAGLY